MIASNLILHKSVMAIITVIVGNDLKLQIYVYHHHHWQNSTF
jgi:hypothetical protein